MINERMQYLSPKFHLENIALYAGNDQSTARSMAKYEGDVAIGAIIVEQSTHRTTKLTLLDESTN